MNNDKLYGAVQRTLVVGMALSFGLMGLGLLALLVARPDSADAVIALPNLPAALGRLEPAALLASGVLVLMFIPAVHLSVALVSFWRTSDKRYVALAGYILLLLLSTIALAFK